MGNANLNITPKELHEITTELKVQQLSHQKSTNNKAHSEIHFDDNYQFDNNINLDTF